MKYVRDNVSIISDRLKWIVYKSDAVWVNCSNNTNQLRQHQPHQDRSSDSFSLLQPTAQKTICTESILSSVSGKVIPGMFQNEVLYSFSGRGAGGRERWREVFFVCVRVRGGGGGRGGGDVFFPLLYSFCLSFFSFFLLFVWWRRSVSFSLFLYSTDPFY